MTDTALLNRPSQKLVEHLKRTRVLYLKEADAAEAAGIKVPRLLDASLADALEFGVIVRKRLGRDIVYMLPDPQQEATPPAPSAPPTQEAPDHTRAVAAQPAPSAPSAAPMPDLRPLAQRIEQQAAPVAQALDALTRQPAAGTPKSRRPQALPPIDIATVPFAYEPLADGRVISSESKWDQYFEALAKKPIGPAKDGVRTFPTMTFPASYGKAMQSAARKWSKRNTPMKIRVMASTSECKAQRVA